MATASIALILEVASPSDLLARHYPNGKLGGLSIEGLCPGALGEFVQLTVRVRRPSREFSLRGQLAWARHKGSKMLAECFGVDFMPEDDAVRLRLLAFARAEVSAYATRLEQRVQVELPVRVLHDGLVRKEFLADLSTGGALIRTSDPIGLGERVELVVRPRLSLLGVHVKGRVAWVRRTGQHPGMGIEFIDADGSARARVDRLLARYTRP